MLPREKSDIIMASTEKTIGILELSVLQFAKIDKKGMK